MRKSSAPTLEKKQNPHTTYSDDLHVKLEIENIQALLGLMEKICSGFYDIEPKKNKWMIHHFRKLSSVIHDCREFQAITSKNGLSAWDTRMTSLLASLYYLDEFKKTPSLPSYQSIHRDLMDLEQDVCQLYIWKQEHANKPVLASASKLIFILEDDESYAEIVAARIKDMGFDVECFSGIDDMRAATKRIHPDLVLVDLNLREGILAGIDYLRKEVSTFPKIVISARQDVEARLQAVRVGAKEFLTKPLDMEHLGKVMSKHLELGFYKRPRAMIIDDDQLLGDTYASYLEQYDIDGIVLSDPKKALEVIDAERPDVIFMDISMPYANGYEIAEVIRQTYQGHYSPSIVYMTGALCGYEADYDESDLEEGGVMLKPLQPIQMAKIVSRYVGVDI